MHQKKSIVLTYFLLLAGSVLGLHLFYLGFPKRAKAYLFTSIGVWITFITLAGISAGETGLIFGLAMFLLIAYFLFWVTVTVYDGINIPKMINRASGTPSQPSLSVLPQRANSPSAAQSNTNHRIISKTSLPTTREKIAPTDSRDHEKKHAVKQERVGKESSLPIRSSSSKTKKSKNTTTDRASSSRSKGPLFATRRLGEIGQYVVVDIETTGLDKDDDRIIEIAAIKYEGLKEIDRFTSFVRPYTLDMELSGLTLEEFESLRGKLSLDYIPDDATRIHGITNDMVDDAPSEKEVFLKLEDFVGSLPTVGHNIIHFDTRFIRNAFKRNKIPSSYGHLQYDTYQIARKVLPYDELLDWKLSTVGNWLDIPGGGLHRAEDDAAFNALVFQNLVRYFKNNERLTDHSFVNSWNIDYRSFKPEGSPDRTNPLYGKNVLITGEFPVGKAQVYQDVANLGSIIKKSITLKFDGYVIHGIFNNADGTKSYQKAKRYQIEKNCDITFLSYEEFLEIASKNSDGSPVSHEVNLEKV